jgi:hypothetical protein
MELIELELDGSDARLTLRAAHLAGLLRRQPLERNDLEHVLCVLWFLQEWGLITREWGLARKVGHVALAQLPVGLHVIAFVARIKTVYKAERETIADLSRSFEGIVRDVEEFLQCDRTSASRHMGVAHVAYWAWKRADEFLERLALRPDVEEAAPQLSALARTWAKRSFAAAEEAMTLCQPGSLQFAFALNHCVYVGHAARVNLDRVSRYYQQLSSDADLHRHYRFADTLATPFTMAAHDIVNRYTLEHLIDDASLEAQRSNACEALQHSQELLVSAQPFFGDEEALEHLEKVKYLRLCLNCLGGARKF